MEEETTTTGEVGVAADETVAQTTIITTNVEGVKACKVVTVLDAVIQLKRFIIAMIMIMGFWCSVAMVLHTQTDFGADILDKLVLLVAVVISFYFGKQVGEATATSST